MGKTLNREEILNTLDLLTDTIHIPRWGGDVLVKAMRMADRRYINYVTGGVRQKGVVPQREIEIRTYVGAVILSALDPETEKPMFTWNDADEVRGKHWNSLLAIANKAFSLASDTAEEKAAWRDEEVDSVTDGEMLELHGEDIIIESDGPSPVGDSGEAEATIVEADEDEADSPLEV